MRHPRPHSRGFTLIELILILLIVAVMVSIIAPSLRGFGIGRRSAEVAQQLVGLANYSRSQSASEGRRYRLNFDANRRIFGLTVEEEGVFGPPPSEYGAEFSLPDGMGIRYDVPTRDDGTYIEFRPDGRTEPAHIF